MSHIVKIKLTRETREALKAMGRKGETYDAVIRRLMEREERERGEGG